MNPRPAATFVNDIKRRLPMSGVDQLETHLQSIRRYYGQRALEAHRSAILDTPTALVPVQDFNAIAGTLGAGEEYVLINWGVPMFFGLFAGMYGSSMVTGIWDDGLTERRDQLLVSGGCGLLLNDLEMMKDVLAEASTLEGPGQPFYVEERHLIEAALVGFVALHEYGHIALGHGGRERRIVPGRQVSTVSLREYDEQDEYAADAFAHKTISRGEEGSGLLPDLMAASGDACLSVLRLLEYLQQIADHWLRVHLARAFSQEFSGLAMKHVLRSRASHPPMRLRHERMRRTAWDDSPSATTLSKRIQEIVEYALVGIHTGRIKLPDQNVVIARQIQNLPVEVMARAADW